MMKSHYLNYASGDRTTHNFNGNSDNSLYMSNNSNNINSQLRNNNKNISVVNNSAIPYHARENSQPFTYGPIGAVPPTLRPTSASANSLTVPSNEVRPYKTSESRDFRLDFDFSALGERVLNARRSLEGGGANRYVTATPSVNKSYINELKVNDDSNHKYINIGNISANNETIKTTIPYMNGQNSSEGRFKVESYNHYNDNCNNMIKTQPRLTSPLLVRKTLTNNNNSSNLNNNLYTNYNNNNGVGSNNNYGNFNGQQSPTRYGTTTTNTIANTYHYNYGLGLNDVDGKSNGLTKVADNYTKDSPSWKSSSHRYELEDVLRERRERVMNEYRPNTSIGRYTNGTVTLQSTLPSTSLGVSPRQSVLTSSISGQSRHCSSTAPYNYDIDIDIDLEQFHLNWDDEVDNVSTRYKTSNTMHQQHQQRTQRKQGQLYETRDIPLTSAYVKRNYHTISSSLPIYDDNNNKNNNTNNNHSNLMEGYHFQSSLNRETTDLESRLDAVQNTPYEEYNCHSKTASSSTLPTSRPSLLQSETIIKRSATTNTSTAATECNGVVPPNSHTKRFDESTAYGHNFRYGQDEVENGGITSPIYAISTKKAINTCRTMTAATSMTTNTAHLPTSPTSTWSTMTTTTDYTSGMRPETPAFPVTPRTPFSGNASNGIFGNGGGATTPTNVKINGYHQLQTQQYSQQQQQQHQQLYVPPQTTSYPAGETHSYSTETIYGSNYRPRLHSSLSMANSEPQEVAAHLVKFAKDSSKYWYKPTLTREEAIALLLKSAPGTFVIRDSTTYKNAYGLVLRVAQLPPGAASTGRPEELVRHFLIEPTTRGVRLKGCVNEPVFASLSALVYEHSVNQLALPCLLEIPDRDLIQPLVEPTPAQRQLLTQGAACNVLWLFSSETESLTGEEAIRKAIRQMYSLPNKPKPTEVHFKVTQLGITLTDNTRKKFFRKHYTAETISYCAIDPDHRLWTMEEYSSDDKQTVIGAMKKTIFAFVARRFVGSKDNQCHVFCDLAINQPASAIVSFVNRTLPTEKQKNYIL